MCQIAGSKSQPKPEWFNPFLEARLRRQAIEAIPPTAAKAMLTLNKCGKLPRWILDYVHFDDLVRSAESINN